MDDSMFDKNISSVSSSNSTPDETTSDPSAGTAKHMNNLHVRARIAVWDDFQSAPRTIDIDPSEMSVRDYIDTLTLQTYNLSHDNGGSIPYTVIREVTENFIHANFEEPVISILDGGNTIRFADQGPGIKDKDKAQVPGFTSATAEMKEVIRGVGSGFPIVNEYLAVSGGKLIIDDNIREGTVITISLKKDEEIVEAPQTAPVQSSDSIGADQPEPVAIPEIFTQQRYMSASQQKISKREDDVMRLFLTEQAIGPSDLKNMLGMSLGTASRTLNNLEDAGYIVSNSSKKRLLTEEGMEYIRTRFNI